MWLRGGHRKRRWLLLALLISIASGPVAAAEMALPPPNQLRFPKPDDSPPPPQPKPAAAVPDSPIVQKDQKTCAQWTDGCVNCSQGASSDAGPVCSNIGFACQPKEIRCLVPRETPAK